MQIGQNKNTRNGCFCGKGVMLLLFLMLLVFLDASWLERSFSLLLPCGQRCRLILPPYELRTSQHDEPCQQFSAYQYRTGDKRHKAQRKRPLWSNQRYSFLHKRNLPLPLRDNLGEFQLSYHSKVPEKYHSAFKRSSIAILPYLTLLTKA